MTPDEEAAREWLQHMRAGDFEAAWTTSDRLRAARMGTTSPHPLRQFQSIWNGASLNDARVLIRCYHGLGDTIQFIRYAPLVRQRARGVIVWGHERLFPVLRTVAGIDRCLPLHDGDVSVDFDVDVEVMELPYVFRTSLETIPRTIPYIGAEPELLDRTHGPAIGLVWRAGDWVVERSIPFERLSPILDIPATWYVLQGEPGLLEYPAGFGIVRGTHDVVELASVIRSLDLLITIDSMPAHLAGAQGVPVWTLLAAEADWRWMNERKDSPWYPTMRLFRQERAGEWDPVVARVREELMTFIERRART